MRFASFSDFSASRPRSTASFMFAPSSAPAMPSASCLPVAASASGVCGRPAREILHGLADALRVLAGRLAQLLALLALGAVHRLRDLVHLRRVIAGELLQILLVLRLLRVRVRRLARVHRLAPSAALDAASAGEARIRLAQPRREMGRAASSACFMSLAARDLSMRRRSFATISPIS